MLLHRETSAANLIRAWEKGRLRIADRWWSGNLIVTPERLVEDWRVDSPTALTPGDLAPAIELEPNIILLGTGAELVLPDVDLMGELAQRGIGLEIMSTPAACRTYNVLVHEQRRVAAALLNPAA